MALSVFDDEAGPPSESELDGTMGRAAELWHELIRHVGEQHPPVTETWNHGGDKFGWTLRLKRKDRILLHMTPQMGQFLLAVVLGEPAAERAREECLPDEVLELIDGAPRYGEGRGIRVAVRTENDLRTAETLVALKLGA
jgi:hypothetical protein